MSNTNDTPMGSNTEVIRLTELLQKHNQEFRFDPQVSHRWLVNAFREYNHEFKLELQKQKELNSELAKAARSMVASEMHPYTIEMIESLIKKITLMDKTETTENRLANIKWKIGCLMTEKFLEYNDGKFHLPLEFNPAIHSLMKLFESEFKHSQKEIEQLRVMIEKLLLSAGYALHESLIDEAKKLIKA